jgi:hypothetical protein
MYVAAAAVAAAGIGAAVAKSQGNKARDSAQYSADLQQIANEKNMALAEQQMAQSFEASMAAAEMMAGATTEAARIQAEAAKYAADNSYRAAADALAMQKEQWAQYQQNINPYLKSGKAGLNQLSYGLGLPGYKGTGESGYLSRPFQMSDYQADPGYAFRLSEGIKALDRSASANGNLLSGQTLKGVTRFGQDFASNEYQNAYNRYTANQNMRYNQLANLSNMGQNTAVGAGNAGMQMARDGGNIITGAASQANQYGINAAQAQAMGLTNSAQYAGQQAQWANNLGAQYTGQIMNSNLNSAAAQGNAALISANASSYSPWAGMANSLAQGLGNYYATQQPSYYNPNAFSNYNPNQWAGSSNYNY